MFDDQIDVILSGLPTAQTEVLSGATSRINVPDNDANTPPDEWSTPQDAAQADATNEVIEALGEGAYEGNYDQFWDDLESIRDWDMPSWEEPALPEMTCDSVFIPPQPAISGRPENECSRAVRRIARNSDDCPPPIVNCRCEAGSLDCADCADEMLNLAPSASREWALMLRDEMYLHPLAVDLLNAAWNLLQSNADIVRWVACLVRGAGNAECIHDRLFDANDPQLFIFDSNPPWGYDRFGAWTGSFSENIHINTSSAFWLDVTDQFASGSESARACAVARLATLIAHEMLHGCLSLFSDHRDNPDSCDTTYMLENSIQWALAHRFPCITGITACSMFPSSTRWMSDS